MAYSIATIASFIIIRQLNLFGDLDPKPTPVYETVVAQTIGQILQSTGTFTIYNYSNRVISGDKIELHDRVVVDDHSMVNILVHDSFVAQIYGPSQFQIVLSPDHKEYHLKFLNGGDNLTINSINNSNKKISIQTSDGVIIQNNESSQKTSFSLQKNNDASTRSIINQSEVALGVINNDQTIVITGQYAIDFNTMEDSIEILSHYKADPKILAQWVDDTTKSNTTTNAAKPTAPTKKHLTVEELKSLSQLLDKSFFQTEWEDLVRYYLIGQTNEYNVAVANINKRLNRIASIVDLTQKNTNNFAELTKFGQQIIDKLVFYDVSPSRYHNIRVLINKLDELPHHTYGFLYDTHQEIPVTMDFIYSIITFNSGNEHTYQ